MGQNLAHSEQDTVQGGQGFLSIHPRDSITLLETGAVEANVPVVKVTNEGDQVGEHGVEAYAPTSVRTAKTSFCNSERTHTSKKFVPASDYCT